MQRDRGAHLAHARLAEILEEVGQARAHVDQRVRLPRECVHLAAADPMSRDYPTL